MAERRIRITAGTIAAEAVLDQSNTAQAENPCETVELGDLACGHPHPHRARVRPSRAAAQEAA